MKVPAKIYLCLSVIVSLLFLSGCTKEKADAIKKAAERFQNEAVAALTQIDNILALAVAFPDDDPDSVNINDLRDIAPEEFEIGRFLVKSPPPEAPPAPQPEFSHRLLKTAGVHYYAFAGMFANLPEGHLLAAEAVTKCEKHAVNLTLQLINLAWLLRDDKIRVCLNAKRILLSEEIKRDLAERDPGAKTILLINATQRINELKEEEAKLKETALKQCLRAAETGKMVTSLIKSYRSLSVEDIMHLAEESQRLCDEINNDMLRLDGMLQQYQSFVISVQNDPYFKALLDSGN